ncbi:hypothetical protein QNI19_21450 [Cytophagaceae bacterium DM2B3-1]|uniref:Uncharacterized protein n=1 Tax=Xanthocytophaga flava TaxID=3048013 RepID=A0ABT7CP93_9BACT|nr:hypothetical protein [Xanthocytophaga flavus]MDJ1466315.1 hypothetical protein [Xanthocytophaga flavus]MDJ1495520.1 hypothetical protein [Xanthocytophaga flavus]
MRNNSFGAAYLFAVTILVLIVFAVLKYLQIQAGTLVDWVIGIVAFWWLTGITTIPWNMHFAAKEVLVDAQTSSDKGIEVKAADISYAQRLSKRFLWAAIFLHIISAVVLYLLAYYGVTVVGYMASLAALGLTFVRPLSRLYDYVVHRLQSIRHEIRYPRDDVYELSAKLNEVASKVTVLEEMLNLSHRESWASKHQAELAYLTNKLSELDKETDRIKQQNAREHEQLARRSEQEIAKLSEDAQFLNQVRELIRFVKGA